MSIYINDGILVLVRGIILNRRKDKIISVYVRIDMIKRYYHSHKDLTLFLVSVFLILVGWGVSVVTFVMFKGKEGKSSLGSAPISLLIRVVYGLVSTISTNYYLTVNTKRLASSFLDNTIYILLV